MTRRRLVRTPLTYRSTGVLTSRASGPARPGYGARRGRAAGTRAGRRTGALSRRAGRGWWWKPGLRPAAPRRECAAAWTAIPRTSSPSSSTSPAWTPARAVRPWAAAASIMAAAPHRTGWAVEGRRSRPRGLHLASAKRSISVHRLVVLGQQQPPPGVAEPVQHFCRPG